MVSHFAAFEQPEIFAREVRAAFARLRIRADYPDYRLSRP